MLSLSRLSVATWLACWFLVATAQAAERFRLEVPGDPTLTSMATLSGEFLEVRDAAGQRTVYRYRPELDSPDGSLRGFYNSAMRQAMRWPVAGRGPFEIGSLVGSEMRWRQSRMLIVPDGVIGAAPGFNLNHGGQGFNPNSPQMLNPNLSPSFNPNNTQTFSPLNPQGFNSGPSSQAFPLTNSQPLRHREAVSVHVATVNQGNAMQVGWIDQAGSLALMQGLGDRWQRLPAQVSAALVPGASLALARDRAGAWPLVYTCDSTGRLLEIIDGRQARICGSNAGGVAPRFTPGGYVARCTDNTGAYVIASDTSGRLWAYRVGEDRFEAIGREAGVVPAGAPLGVAQGGTLAELFVIDLRGDIRGYLIEHGQWSAPQRLANGFQPSGYLAGATMDGPAGTQIPVLASVDAAGLLQVGRVDGDRWQRAAFDRAPLSAGAPLALQIDAGLIRVGVVTPSRRLVALQLSGNQPWDAVTAGEGFAPYTPVSLGMSGGPIIFSTNESGQVIATSLGGGRWQPNVVGGWGGGFNEPGFNSPATQIPQGPRLVRRTARPGAALAPAAVELVNSQSEELALKIVDLNDPRRPVEFSIKPGRSVVQRFERDAGGEVEEVYMVPDETGQSFEDVRVRKTPPQPRYEISVFSNRVVSEFFDRTQSRSTTPDEVSRGLTSVGTIRLPAGDQLRDGEQIDIFREASRQANAGQSPGISP